MAKAVVRRISLVKKAGPPRRYRIMLLGEPRVPIEIVVRLLRAVFRKTTAEAFEVMDEARRTGAGVVAVYTQEVAEMKLKIAGHFAAKLRQAVGFRVDPEE